MLTLRYSLKAALGMVFAAALSIGLFGVPSKANAAGNLVLNGSFEQVTGVGANGGYICSGSIAACGTQSNVTNWFSTCNTSCGNGNSVGSILFGGTGGSAFNGGIGLSGAAPNSPDAGNFIGIDGDPKYTVALEQTVTGLTAGSSYLLTFYQAGDQQAGSNTSVTTTDQWQVSLGGSAAQNSALITNTNGSFTGWTKQSLTFIADASTDVLKFIAKGTPAGVPPVSLLDGVSLTLASTNPVPEPAAWTLLVAGLVAITVLKGRGRSRGRDAA